MTKPTEMQFARSAERDPFGKLDDVLEIRINSDIRSELEREAALAGMGAPELVRILIYVRLRGLEHVLSVKQDRIRRASGNVGSMSDSAQSEGQSA